MLLLCQTASAAVVTMSVYVESPAAPPQTADPKPAPPAAPTTTISQPVQEASPAPANMNVSAARQDEAADQGLPGLTGAAVAGEPLDSAAVWDWVRTFFGRLL
jgi:hypothetical protein